MFTFSKRNYLSTGSILNSMVRGSKHCSLMLRSKCLQAFLNTKNISASRLSMTLTRGMVLPASLISCKAHTYRYETISDLMTLQDLIDAFQKSIFANFRSGSNNECRISALVPLVQESYGIYKFITSMLRAMHTSPSCPLRWVSTFPNRFDSYR